MREVKDSKPLIIGCGGSGTWYLTNVMNTCNRKISHEQLGKNGMVCWHVTPENWHEYFEDTFPDLPRLTKKKYPMSNGIDKDAMIEDCGFTDMLHQIRNPLDVISTVQAWEDEVWNYIKNFIPIEESDNKILKCMKYWYYWNLLAEKRTKRRYCVEDLTALFGDIMHIDSNSMKDEYAKLSWEDLDKTDKELALKIRDKGREYGYTIPYVA